MQKQSVSDELQQLRVEAGMSQRELAELLDVNVASICRWESGTRFPKRDKLERIAALFHKSIAGVSAPITSSDTLGYQLHELRTKSGLTLDQAAELLEVTAGTIFHWENDDCPPKPKNLKKLADLYNQVIAGIRPPTNKECSAGEKMKKMRMQANYSQVLAAELLHCAQKDISRWENNVVVPTHYYLKKMAELYKCNINDLI